MTDELKLGEVLRVQRDVTAAEANAIATTNDGEVRTYWALAYDATSTDRHGTRMTPDAFNPSANAMEFPILLFHEANRFPVAKPVAIEYKTDGLHVGFQFANTPEAKIAESLVADGFLRGVSVGFIPQDGYIDRVDGEPVVTFTKADLLELSLTPTPSSKGALIDLTREVGEDPETLDAFLELFDIADLASDENPFDVEADTEDAPCCEGECSCDETKRQEAIDALRALGVAEDILSQIRTTTEEPVDSETAATVNTDRERALRNLSLLRRFSR